MKQEELQKKLNELLEGVVAGDFNQLDQTAPKYTYGHLIALFYVLDKMSNGKILFNQIYDSIMSYATNYIKEKSQSGEKIKIAFMTISAAEWPAEDVYQKMLKNDKFDAYVIGLPLTDRDKESSLNTYHQNKNYFMGNGYRYVDTIAEDGHFKSWDELGGVPDILVNLTSWNDSVAEEYQIDKLPITCLNCYIPYAFYIEDSVNGKYLTNGVYNKEFMNVQWKIFTDSAKNYEGYRKKQTLGAKNVVCSGYTKMDYFYQGKQYSDLELKRIWKMPEGELTEQTKKIIVAPHYTIGSSSILQFSTFDKNMYFLYYLAQKNPQISFVFKPHPNLRNQTVKVGIFKSYEEYDAYIAMWNELPNAQVIQEGYYLDVFATSDGMILDSISFLAEYMYVDKPVLFLTREGQRFNELGNELYQTFHLANGTDYQSIECFVQEVIVNEKDNKQGIRQEIFHKELDYMKVNEKQAFETICEHLEKLVEG